MRRLPALFAVLALAVPVATPLAAQETAKPVKLMTVTAKPQKVERQFFGQVTALQTVDLAFQVGGQIQVLTAPEGQPIAKDSVIAQLDLDAFDRAKAQAEVNLDKANRDLARLESLSGAAVSEVSIRDARTQVQLAEIALKDAQDNLDHATLRSPFDALVARREVANFTTVSAGTPVVRLHDVSEMRVEIEVPEVLFRQAGQSGDVTFEAQFPGATERLPLTPREFEAETSAVGQTYTLTLAFTGDLGAGIYPGASVTVYAGTELPAAEAVFLPETALAFDPAGKPQVMVFDQAGTVHATPIQIEITTDGRVRLVGGIDEGAEIVSTGASQLQDGQSVRRFTRVGE
ncbi:efflux RND transporter periplasmic adaptor subunit [Donghicola sp. C2-DW-16]|uniref:Efflux RND transporter periplasmic adaptor subunit n=1 Tax=Donghicola mangrovi TaxID=2729614 RepID=A0ABX2PFH3_9RHOB|nr:efflux RND transporter periplasmic adaptor subunit [Donghicola mangrovi]NVO28209.1 efflux RND transporter periplasmic adaptor subunit [Donghicola mangrovi]